MKAGKEVALRKEKGIFCILFVAAWTKRMASGGMRPAGSGFDFGFVLKVFTDFKKTMATDEQSVAIVTYLRELPTQGTKVPGSS